MVSKTYYVLVLIFSSTLGLFAQRTPSQTQAEQKFFAGLDLLEKQKYEAARKVFIEYAQASESGAKKTEAQYQAAHCARQLFHPDLEQVLKNFIESNSKTVWFYPALFDLGAYYYHIKKYDLAIEVLSRIPALSLPSPKQEESDFKLAYSLFSEKQYDRANPIFQLLKAKKHPFQAPSNYYSGFLNFKEGKYADALSDLEQVSYDAQYKSLVPTLKANIYYRKKEYDKVIEIGEQTSKDTIKVEGLDELNVLVGECFFLKKNYTKANEYFAAYTKGFKGNLPNPLQYRIAFTQFKTNQTDKAIAGFSKVASKLDTSNGKKDTLGQYASYFLGVCYLKTDKKQFALSSFDIASSMDADPNIQESAWFNFGKLQYDLEKYSEAVETLKEYLESYPNSEHAKESREIVGEALLNSNDYDAALEYIESLKGKSERLNAAYQRVTFQKGTVLFNENQYLKATEYFEKSLKYPIDQEVVAAANFWLGEAYSNDKQYEKAVNAYGAVFKTSDANKTPYFLKSRYGIGYAYFNQREYEKAAGHFKEYVSDLEKAPVKQQYTDALIRLGDCNYVLKNYQAAVSQYDKALDNRTSEPDYALYQKGLIYSILREYDKARTSFSVVIEKYSKSRFYDEALFQNAQMEFESGNYASAAAGFTSIINTMAGSPVVPFCLLKRALAYFNLKEYDKASADYKRILDTYPTHKTANSAMLGLQETLAITGNIDEISDYVSKFKKANPESDALESIEFETNKALYFNQKYTKAIRGFEDYLKNYPDNAFSSDARFFLAESYYRSADKAKSLEIHKDLIASNKGNNLIKSVARAAELELSFGNFKSSIALYNKLLSGARNKKDQNNAYAGLIECYYQLASFDTVTSLVAEIQKQEGASIDAQNKASLYLGKVLFAKKDYDKAMDELLSTVNNSRDATAAEAQYLVAEILYMQKKYNESLAALFELKSNFGNYPKWYNKGFLLLADNYIAQKEIFQAQATLKSIIDNSKDKETIEAAKAKLQTLNNP